MIQAFCFNTVPFNDFEGPERDARSLLPANHAELRTWAGRHPSRSDLATYAMAKLMGRPISPKRIAGIRKLLDATSSPRGRPKFDATLRNKIICERYPKYLAELQAHRKTETSAQRRAMSKVDRFDLAPNRVAAHWVSEDLEREGLPFISAASVQKIYSSAKKK